MQDDDDVPPPSRRQVARKERRVAGDRSSDLARTLMSAPDSTIAKLQLDEDLADVITRARKVTSPIARRRAERSLAGELRKFELEDVEKKLVNVQEKGSAEPRLFAAAEKWRTRLIEDPAAVKEFAGADDTLTELIARARRERDTGKPPGASRALFRHVRMVLEQELKRAAAEED